VQAAVNPFVTSHRAICDMRYAICDIDIRLRAHRRESVREVASRDMRYRYTLRAHRHEFVREVASRDMRISIYVRVLTAVNPLVTPHRANIDTRCVLTSMIRS
jgi:hypothetical protein